MRRHLLMSEVFGAEVLLWQIGNAKCTFPDTAAGHVLDVILIESWSNLVKV